MFGLSALEMEQEPTDQFFTNLYILAQIAEKQQAEQRLNNRG